MKVTSIIFKVMSNLDDNDNNNNDNNNVMSTKGIYQSKGSVTPGKEQNTIFQYAKHLINQSIITA